MQKLIEFTKMHGAGNDYIYVDTTRFPILHPEVCAKRWSDRHKGIGGDGLVLIGPSEVGDFSMRIFNADGSEARMCGNASRCVGKYLYDKGLTTSHEIRLETRSGIKVLHLLVGKDGKVCEVTVDMGCPTLADPSLLATPDGSMKEGIIHSTSGHEVSGTFVSMGNPHFVVFTKDVEGLSLSQIGPTLEHASVFPERCNIEFAEIKQGGNLRMRVWERGSGITLACGTGACATAVAGALTGRTSRSVNIIMDGGKLHIEWNESDGHVYMTGEATEVFNGHIIYDDAP